MQNRRKKRIGSLIFITMFLLNSIAGISQDTTVKLGLLKYGGGGDWYANPTSLPNLAKFCNESLNFSIDEEPVTVEVGSRDIFNVPFVHITGHGNVLFSE